MPDHNLSPEASAAAPSVDVIDFSLADKVQLDVALGADDAAQISAFEQILERFEQNTLTERDKGTAFELLVRDVLSQAQPWCERFEKVQTYAEWAKEHPELSGGDARDTGIDLVATNRGGYAQNFLANTPPLKSQKYTYTAIQCKFFGRDQYIPKSQVDSFLSDSEPEHFTHRIFVYTGRLSEHAQKELSHRPKHVETISRSDLEEANIDWNGFLKTGQVLISKRQLRPYQQEALEDVIEGFKHYNRGKLIMACGTGKTFTSLKIAERQTNNHGFVLFLMPSLALLSQTLYDWKRQASAAMTAFAVCSDSKVGKSGDEDDFASYLRPSDLSFPATTNAQSLAQAVNASLAHKGPADGMTVIFSTYQSLDVIHQAQTDYGLPALDLIICDEAHRTAGGYLVADRKSTAMTAPLDAEVKAQESADVESKGRKPRGRRGADSAVDDESNFTRIHDDDYIKGLKRLYMTATPKIYGDAAKQQETAGEAVLYSMDDEKVFGPVFHTLNFDRAVKLGCLVDYKVIILVGDKSLLPTDESLLDFSQFHAAKVVGTWKALNKYGVSDQLTGDSQPMRRAVGFAQIIDSKGKYDKAGSKQFTKYFQGTVEHYREHIAKLSLTDPEGRASEEFAYLSEHNLVCDCEHIDGSMDAITKGQLLDWLRAEPEDNHCKILFNVRCLSEGVDVPALDAVVFLSPRKSQVDVVQTVGRVMRTAPGKTRGYVIIPVVTNDLDHPESIFDKNQSFDVVWQVLNALKAINPDHVLIDGLTQKIDDRIEVVCVHKDKIKGRSDKGPEGYPPSPPPPVDPTPPQPLPLFDWDKAIEVEETIKSTIIKRLGSRKEWQDWAEDVAGICTEQVKQIKQLLATKADPEFKAAFAQQCLDLNDSIGQHLEQDEIIEMLAQHIVIKPVLDELFRGFPFTEHNPIARGLSDMLEQLDAVGLTKTNADLRAFYQSVGFRMKNVTSVEDRQKVIVDLFDRFFKVAFPKQQEKLGIVYTPIEVVDFINHSVNDILKQEFGVSLGSQGVHILDPFTGTGTFITRMMQSPDLIAPSELEHKYRNELHAHEILPLAYYVAAINIESVYHSLMAKDADHYERNRVVILTDTFAEAEEKAHTITGSFGENSQLRDEIRALPLKVIVGNPPYSIGQESQNDDNQNTSYPALEKRIADTYVAQASAGGLKKGIYDSYVKAFRWASDRLGEQGVIAFVSNAGWLDGAAANGMRRCLQQEFSSVYVYHLKGNQRTSGEQSRKEGGKIFGAGSRAPIAVTILVKNPQAQEQGKIYFAAVGDYLTREDKLGQLKELGSVLNVPLTEIIPDAHGDWLNQRRDDFSHFITVDGKKTDGLAIFDNFSLGTFTSRDAWSYNANKSTIVRNFKNCIAFYNEQVDEAKRLGDNFECSKDKTRISWDRPQKRHVLQGKYYDGVKSDLIVSALYRPFFKEFLYNDRAWINCVYQMPQLFPFNGAENLVISACGVGSKSFSCLMSSIIMDLNSMEAGAQCFPRYLYRKVGSAASASAAGGLMAGLEETETVSISGVVVNGYERIDAIRPEAVEHFKAAYPEDAAAIDVDAVFYYIYGIMHSPDYRETYANNLQKELPRIPRVATYDEFKAFEDAGRALAQLHVDYEKVEPYAGCTLKYAKGASSSTMDYRVDKLKYGKIKGKTGNAAKDKTVIIYNDDLTITGIPLEAQEYVVNKKSALDWIVERCGVSVDKASRIINDYNDYATEMGDERYILKLILRVITVSLETMKIVKALPPLTIHKLDQ
ncbi:MAG TPA: DEAD/DEAH box helicase family protein [Candidatus Anaerobiospirillum stercoravium]|nr:DEAD/DEAH box helicase family protein [Candidatus Anaerobiospirillum stercoravium]